MVTDPIFFWLPLLSSREIFYFTRNHLFDTVISEP